MIEELARHRCLSDDGSAVTVVERRHVFVTQDVSGVRRRPGARWTALLDGEPVRPAGTGMFEVVATGEILVHDPDRCSCASAAVRPAVGQSPSARVTHSVHRLTKGS